MIGALIILLLAALQCSAGFGVLSLCNVRLKPGMHLSLSMLLGVAVFSFVPFLMQLLYLPLTHVTVSASLVVACVLLNIKFAKSKEILRELKQQVRFKIALYEIPFLLILGVIMAASIWRCFYFPPTPRDLTSGAEAIAEYALREKTLINSVFTVNTESTNNVFKPPYVICLQLIYKMAGFPFGQLWLSMVFISFTVFLYHALSLKLHKILAGFLLLCFMAIPEMFAYTFMVLFDYSNAVFFFLSIYFLVDYCSSPKTGCLVLAGLLMGVATYTRSETLVLAFLVAPVVLLNSIKQRQGLIKFFASPIIFLLPTVLLYVLCGPVYLDHYLPVKYDVAGLVTPHLLDFKPLLTRFKDMNTQLMFSQTGINYYGYFIFLFIVLMVAEVAVVRWVTREAANWLYAVLVIYVGLAILGYLLPLMDLDNSTKRGLFKIFPLMLLYMANNGLLVKLSGWLARVTKSDELA